MTKLLRRIRNFVPFSYVGQNFDYENYVSVIPETGDKESVLGTTAYYVIVTEFCERLAYYGFASSLVLFFQRRMGMSNAEADIQYAAWSGACYITPLIGGYIADTFLGRFHTIVLFSSVYLLGLLGVVFGAVPEGDGFHFLVVPSIYIIALGAGGIKPNVPTLGADQFSDVFERDRLERESFFHWFYWSVNLASIFAYSGIAYICQNGLPGYLGGQDWGFFIGYLIPCCAMVVGICVFLVGAPLYVKHSAKVSVISSSIRLIWEALYRSIFSRKDKQNAYKAIALDENQSSDTLCDESCAPLLPDEAHCEQLPTHWIEYACSEHGGSWTSSQVTGVKVILELVPFLFALVPYWGVYSQVHTTFQNQGCQMNLDSGTSFEVPISALGIFEAMTIIVCVPLLDIYIHPYMKSINRHIPLLARIGIGFIMAMLAMLIAACVEYFRVEYSPAPGKYDDVSARNNITPCQSIDDYNPYNYQDWYAGIDDTDQPAYCHQTCDTSYEVHNVVYLNMSCIDCDDIPQMSGMSIFWQIPQVVCIGVSLLLTGITALEFFYSQAPLPLRSVCQSFNLFTHAIGAWCSILLVLIVNVSPQNEWLPRNLDEGYLSYYFIILAAIMLFDIVYFYHVCGEYVHKSESYMRQLSSAMT